MASILTSVKKYVGGEVEYEDHFDSELIIDINSAFMTLQQIGVGPVDGFFIDDATTDWSAYVCEPKVLSGVKAFVNLRVKLTFDPPQSTSALNAMHEQLKELTWRLNVFGGGE